MSTYRRLVEAHPEVTRKEWGQALAYPRFVSLQPIGFQNGLEYTMLEVPTPFNYMADRIAEQVAWLESR